MKLGFNMLLWSTHVTDDLMPVIHDLKATGYDGIEIPLFEGEVSYYSALGRRIADAGLEVTAVGIMPGGGKNAVSPDKAERAAALDHIKWLIDCTAALGGKMVGGPLHQPLGEFTGVPATADERKRAIEVLKLAAQHGANCKIGLTIEPLNRFECYFLNTGQAAADLVISVDEPNLGYLYDTFHFNIEENSMEDAIAQTAAQINHVHIAENNRGTPGAGHIDFASVFKALRAVDYDGWMTVEAFSSSLPDLAAATKIWRPLFDEPEDVYKGAYKLMREGWDAAL